MSCIIIIISNGDYGYITLKKGCAFTSSASAGPPPNLCLGSLTSNLHIKSFVVVDKSSGMGGSIFKIRLKLYT